MLRCALDARRGYAALGLPEAVYADTMACFPRFVREHKESCGSYGFDRGFWTVRQVSCRLFRIGEMEYKLTALEGEKAISLHIPSDAHLDGFQTSWAEARPLLDGIFPEYRDAPVLCRFAIRPMGGSAGGFVKWVFKNPRLSPEDYPENTTLQRRLKRWVLEGGSLTDGLGILKDENMT